MQPFNNTCFLCFVVKQDGYGNTQKSNNGKEKQVFAPWGSVSISNVKVHGLEHNIAERLSLIHI